MQLIDGRPVYAATDLVGFLACGHRLALERAAMHGLVARPVRNDPSIELVAKRGLEHERRYLEGLRAGGRQVVEIRKDGSRVEPLPGSAGDPAARDPGAELREAAAETVAAMTAGADVVYQATFFDGTWRGHADFLLRRDHEPDEPASAFGPWHYEVADTKLARHVKASAVLQICSYVELLTAVQRRQPEFLHVVLGGSARPTDSLRVDDYMAYYRRVRSEFETAVGLRGDAAPAPAYPPAGTYPEPVEHCDVCRWNPVCRARRRADDDLSLVAGATGRQRRALKDRDIGTRRGLAGLRLPMAPALDGVGAGALERIREQARIQVEGEDAGRVLWELLPLERKPDGVPVPDRGLLILPDPSPSDLFLDLEGDPFALDDGIDYLFGILEPDAEEDGRWAATRGAERVPKFHAIWSLDDDGRVTWAAEKAAFERTVDLIMDRWGRDPSLHVYHYAAYERTALGRLAQRHGTREEEVDRLLRGGVLVDLFRTVRQGIRASVESYSIKRIEPLYSLEREIDLRDAGSSIVAFEGWLELGSDAPVDDGPRILAGIEDYNRDDVLSNWRLRDWLEERRADLEAREGERLARPVVGDGAAAPELNERQQLVADVAAALTIDDPGDPVERAAMPDVAARWLLAQLLAWHRREDKSAWWRFFDLMGRTEDELIEEREPLAGLELVGSWPVRQSVVYRFAFPPQDHRIGEDSDISDPRTRNSAGEVIAVDDVARTIDIRRGPSLDGVPLPRAIVPSGVVPSKELAESLIRTGEWVVARGMHLGDAADDPDHATARALLLRTPPDTGQPAGSALRRPGEPALDAAIRIVREMRDGVLPIQGPPGSGKTYTGARMILALVRGGGRVGVVANSHKVIGKVLDEVAKAAAEAGVHVRIGQKPKNGQAPTHAPATPMRDNGAVEAALRAGTVDVVGAVAWTWCRAEMARPEPVVDVLVVDEAGQMSLANVLACAPAARKVVLLGDPQQLDQPVQGSHPPGADRSALSHLLADPAYLRPDRATIDPSEGLFLERTWRLHPDVCDFTSTAFYAGRLLPVDGLERQQVSVPEATDLWGASSAAAAAPLAGTGMRCLPVPHAGNATDSPEEAAAVARLVGGLLAADATWTDAEGERRRIAVDDVVIVAPYNAHVAAIERAFEDAGLARPFVGTVDKFQGQEAPVSIYAMGTSAPEDAPRGMEFLYSLNRLNVATSRARCVAAVVLSPALIRVACRTPRQMRLANGLCLAVEAAERRR